MALRNLSVCADGRPLVCADGTFYDPYRKIRRLTHALCIPADSKVEALETDEKWELCALHPRKQ